MASGFCGDTFQIWLPPIQAIISSRAACVRRSPRRHGREDLLDGPLVLVRVFPEGVQCLAPFGIVGEEPVEVGRFISVGHAARPASPDRPGGVCGSPRTAEPGSGFASGLGVCRASRPVPAASPPTASTRIRGTSDDRFQAGNDHRFQHALGERGDGRGDRPRFAAANWIAARMRRIGECGGTAAWAAQRRIDGTMLAGARPVRVKRPLSRSRRASRLLTVPTGQPRCRAASSYVPPSRSQSTTATR